MHMNKAICLCSLFLCLLTGCGEKESLWADAPDVKISQTETEQSQTVQTETEQSQTVQTENPLEIIGAGAEPETEALVMVSVHVCGAVESPGVYSLPSDARIADAVEAAGGFTEAADTGWCNLAKYISDEAQIRIYTVDETAAIQEAGGHPEALTGAADSNAETYTAADLTGAPARSQNAAGSVTVNLNTATKDELKTLSGIGDVRADAIISYREQNGPFTSTDQIMNVSGIGKGLFANIQNDITV